MRRVSLHTRSPDVRLYLGDSLSVSALCCRRVTFLIFAMSSRRPRAEEVRWAEGSPNTPAGDRTYDVVYFTDPPGSQATATLRVDRSQREASCYLLTDQTSSHLRRSRPVPLPTHLAGLCTSLLNDFSNREGKLSTVEHNAQSVA